MLQKLAFLFFIIGILSLGGCYYDNGEHLYPNSFCDTINVTYSGTIEPLLRTNCAVPGCHAFGGEGTGDFTQFGVVAAAVDDGTLQTVLNARSMPPLGYAPLRACQVQQIGKWVANGALND